MSDDLVTEQRQQMDAVAEYINEEGPVTRDQVARDLGLRGQVARQLIRMLVGDRQVTQGPARRGIPTYTSAPGWRAAEPALSVVQTPVNDGTPPQSELTPEPPTAPTITATDGGDPTDATVPETVDTTEVADDTAARQDAALELLQANPDGLTTAAVAEALGITSDKAYRAIDALRVAEKVEKAGTEGRAAVWRAVATA